ncbi:unnamed protein product [Echinostoma caproni]|uniref:Tetraspanin n=1 Tax=Echinostoma caproni TaxID=27848 RepID=A0A183AB30_9TREM|nr:unnamed protein product [Echinostoma caproni]
MCKSITCIILGVFNVAMLIGGLALLILGALMRWNKPLLKQICDVSLKFMREKLGDEAMKTAEIAIDRIQEFAGPFGLVVFIGGIVIACVAGLAFIGLCCHIKLFLIILLKYAYEYMQKAVQNYVSMESGTVESAVMTIIMPTIGCCGFNSAEDFNAVEAKFSKQDTIGNVTIKDLQYPVPCCDLKQELKDAPGYCPRTFTAENSFIKYGCKAQMESYVFNKIALGSLVVLAVTPFKKFVSKTASDSRKVLTSGKMVNATEFLQVLNGSAKQ